MLREPPASWFRRACERITHPLACVGCDHKFVWVNGAFERLVGYTNYELHALTWMDITAATDIGHDLACVREVIAGQRSEYVIEKSYQHKTGIEVPIELCVWRFPDGGDLLCFIVQARPIEGDPAMIEQLRREIRSDYLELKDRIEKQQIAQDDMIRRDASSKAVVVFLQEWGWAILAVAGLIGWIINLAVSH